MIGFVTWPPLAIMRLAQKRWPSDKANHTCETCYKTIVFHSSSLKHLSVIGDFLASADIKVFGCT